VATQNGAAAFSAGPSGTQELLNQAGGFLVDQAGNPLLLQGGSVPGASMAVTASSFTPDLNGSASLSGSGQMAVGRITGSGFLSGSGTMTAGAAVVNPHPSAGLSAAPVIGISARVIKNASASLSAAVTMTASGFVPLLTARPVMGATATVHQAATAHLTAGAVLAAATSSSAVSLTAGAVLLAPGRAAAARLLAGTSLTASGSYFMPGQVALYAAAAMAGTAHVTERASAHLAASTALAASALLRVSGAAALHGSAALAAAPFTASAHLAAAPQLAAAGGKTAKAAAGLHAPGSVTVAAKVTEHARAALSAPAALSSHAVVAKTARAALGAAAVLHAAGIRGVTGHVSFAAATALTALGARTAVAQAALSAPGSASAGGQVTPGARMHASPSLAAGAVLSRPGRAALAATARLTGTAHGTVFPSAAFTAPGVFLPTPLGVVRAQAALTGRPCLLAAAETRPELPFPVRPAGQQPAWQRDVQRFAIVQERQRHAQALWQYGELAVFALLWRPEDIGLGLAQRCTRCWNPSAVIDGLPPDTVPPAGYYTIPGVEEQISAAYGQGNQYRCTLCYGTQVIAAKQVKVPGVRALLVRPTILTDTDQNQQRTAKGTVNTGSVSVQSTPDFRVNTLDYVFRSDGRRYQLAVPARTTLRTGFGSPWQQAAAISYNLSNASLEDPKASVAYVIPPPNPELERMLGTYTRIPADFAWFEQVNGPLIPGEDPPPTASGLYQPPVSLGVR
jgi:hypothetical protein